jgi:hypothetical protein
MPCEGEAQDMPVAPVVGKALKGKKSVKVGIGSVLKTCPVKLLVEQGLTQLDQGKQTPCY